jgi:hypothetical protein
MDVTDVSQKGKIDRRREMRVHNRETAVSNGTHCPEPVSLLGLRTEIYLHYLYRIEIRCTLLSALGCLHAEHSEWIRKVNDVAQGPVVLLHIWKFLLQLQCLGTGFSAFLGISNTSCDDTLFDSSQIFLSFCCGFACKEL